jgi:hypothetical protein
MAPSGGGPGHGPTGSVLAMGIGHAMRYAMGGARENHGFVQSECSTVCFALLLLSLHFQVKPTHSLHTATDKLVSRHGGCDVRLFKLAMGVGSLGCQCQCGGISQHCDTQHMMFSVAHGVAAGPCLRNL